MKNKLYRLWYVLSGQRRTDRLIRDAKIQYACSKLSSGAIIPIFNSLGDPIDASEITAGVITLRPGIDLGVFRVDIYGGGGSGEDIEERFPKIGFKDKNGIDIRENDVARTFDRRGKKWIGTIIPVDPSIIIRSKIVEEGGIQYAFKSNMEVWINDQEYASTLEIIDRGGGGRVA